jgi:hypothetical protein
MGDPHGFEKEQTMPKLKDARVVRESESSRLVEVVIDYTSDKGDGESTCEIWIAKRASKISEPDDGLIVFSRMLQRLEEDLADEEGFSTIGIRVEAPVET